MKCVGCEVEIPEERLEVLPGVKTCVKCSDEKARVGVTVWDSGTPILIITDEETFEATQKLENIDGRSSRLK